MSSDTKAIIGTIVGTGLAVAGLLSVQISGQISGLSIRIDDMNRRLERLESDVRSMDARLRTVEVAFGKVDQRLETLERAILTPAQGD